MGIFTVPLQHLRNTRIYVSVSDEIPDVQLTLYTNHVATRHSGGYMILPVPYPETVRFHTPNSLRQGEDYLHFMDSVEHAFKDFERYRHRPSLTPGNPHQPRLARYEVEVLDSLEQLQDFNNHEHILHESTMDELAIIYRARHWGFILCKIEEGDYLYEPLCYTHRTLQEKLYIPSLTYNPRGFNDVHIPENYHHFDDKYFINGTLLNEDELHGLQEVDVRKIDRIPWTILPRAFQSCLRMFLMMSLVGSHQNIDQTFPINYLLYNHYRSNNRRYEDWEVYGPLRIPTPF